MTTGMPTKSEPSPAATTQALAIGELAHCLEGIASDDSRDIASYTVPELVHEAKHVLSLFEEHGTLQHEMLTSSDKEELRDGRKQVRALRAFIRRWTNIPGNEDFHTNNVMRRVLLGTDIPNKVVFDIRPFVLELIRNGKSEDEAYEAVKQRREAEARAELDAKANFTRQLWKYYDLDFDVERVEPVHGYGERYKLYGATDKDPNAHVLVRCRLHSSGVVEDLFLWRDGDFIDPTTTQEQQNER